MVSGYPIRSKGLLLIVASIVCVAVVLIGCVVLVQWNPPLVAMIAATSDENRLVLVEVGNKSRLASIHLEDVLVNGGEVPAHVKLQISNPMKGFVVADHAEGPGAEDYHFTQLHMTALQTDTHPQRFFDRPDPEHVHENDRIYAIAIRHHTSVQSVVIQYRYLGLSFEKTIAANFSHNRQLSGI